MAAPTKTTPAEKSTLEELKFPRQGEWTYADWQHLPDDGYKYEIIDGVLHMSPAPSIYHQFVSNRLATALTNHIDKNDLGMIAAAPVDVLLPNQSVPFQPEIVYLARAKQKIIQNQRIEGVPDMVVEIISPGSRYYDREQKFKVYEAAQIPEYWIVDYNQKTIEIFLHRDGKYVRQGETLERGAKAKSHVIPGFSIELSQVFRDL